MLYDLALNQNATVAHIIGHNRYYLIFNKPLSEILRQQLHGLYTQLSSISLNNTEDTIVWRWCTKGLFSTNSCYSWLNFRGIINTQFHSIWNENIPLKIKNILLVI
jgi:hypothetical protein